MRWAACGSPASSADGVIMYVDDPQPFAATLADLAQPGAIDPW